MADKLAGNLGCEGQPLEELDIEERLEDLLGAVLTSRRTASEPAQKLSWLTRHQQDFALHWAGVISKSNSEMAFQFVSHVSEAFAHLDDAGVTQWIIQAMDIYDRDGLYLGSATLRDVENFAAKLAENRYSVEFNDVVGILSKFVIGLSGRNLSIEEDKSAWTDTETIYLPPAIRQFESDRKNFQLYKATVGYMLAQTRHGTFRVDAATGVPFVCTQIADYQNPAKALKLFEAVEQVRLLACLEQELPGLARQMRELNEALSDDSGFANRVEALANLQSADASVLDSLDVVRELYEGNDKVPESASYLGHIDLEKVRLVTRERVDSEREKFRTEMAYMMDGVYEDEQLEAGGIEQGSIEVSFAQPADEDGPGEGELTFTVDGKPVPVPEDTIQTARSIIQDFGEIPDEYLVPAGSGSYDAKYASADDSDDTRSGAQGGICYDEWDYRRCHYRKNWCVLKELDMHPGQAQSVAAILDKYAHLVRDIRKSFEALRGDDRMLRRQKNGDDIDLDAVVESYVDVVKGDEMTDRLFIKSRKLERNLAVVFMVDVSGSTKGWINEAERESLVLLSEALETLGDRYAIYGFSGMTRKRCEVYRIKTFDEPYNSLVKARIAGMKPQDYTRMGVVIRHLSEKLKQVDARTRVLITISDGKPDDYDGYRGEYGIEDTRQALLEAKYAGIHPFCVTIDTHAHEYLPHMYGHVNYTVVSDIRKLPLKVSDIYRKLTT